jgi:hypothetical protein
MPRSLLRGLFTFKLEVHNLVKCVLWMVNLSIQAWAREMPNLFIL